MNIIQAMSDPNLFAPWFKDTKTWRAWRVVLKALFGLKMNRAEARLFTRLTGRERPPTTQASESWWIIGRRGGKSFVCALVAVFLACFRDYTKHLAPGESGVIMVLASDRKQARVILRYIKALLQVPMLAKLIENDTAESIDLTNRVSIEVHTSNFRSVRGYTVLAVLCDEISFWRSDESANPDKEILAAIRPGMGTIPGAMLLGISSPYRRSGVLYEAWRDHWGKDGPVLVLRADSRTMNPTLSKSVVDAAYARDPAAAAAEFGGEFRSDISSFLDETWIDAAIIEGRFELPPLAGTSYEAFTDPSGGRADSFALGIAHHHDGRAVLDVCRHRRPPFDPASVVSEFSDVLKLYGCTSVRGDRYAAEWTVAAFREHEISYEASDKTASELFLELGPALATGGVDLLDNKTLLAELRQLERRTRAGGKDLVSHPPGGHDDLANVVAGAVALAAGDVAESLDGMAFFGPSAALQEAQAEELDLTFTDEGVSIFDEAMEREDRGFLTEVEHAIGIFEDY